MKEKMFFDSNIFIYAADKESLFYAESVGILKDGLQTGLVTCDLCFLEFYQVITDRRKTPNPLEEESQEELVRYNIKKYDIYDYLIALCLKKNGINQIVTFNIRDFQNYPWLTVVDPRRRPSSFQTSVICPLPADPHSSGK